MLHKMLHKMLRSIFLGAPLNNAGIGYIMKPLLMTGEALDVPGGEEMNE
ncbi:hypothetical protein KCG44_03325 [Pacificimonas sp. WHA3]|uniref:Uncharacterized protein n=1 Tax=Pacificimonas pallii TaxID=2827236 RepID=A0ABS6SCJ0_9SPHN|nr:hypothetical protein [Pacificimonas pallii]MBV7255813.1 hypothetical protein [Pacificimonas pallii]